MNRVRFRMTLRGTMTLVAAVALGLFAVRSSPHVVECYRMWKFQNGVAAQLRAVAARFRNCARTLTSGGPDYCNNPCLSHVFPPPRGPAASEGYRAQAREVHSRAAADYEAAAANHRALARVYFWAMFRVWSPVPPYQPARPDDEEVIRRWQCDVY